MRFQEMLGKGKDAEKRIANTLASMGFELRDISEEPLHTSNGTLYSPFDILATSKYYSFVADVRYRVQISQVPIGVRRFISYKNYIPPTGVVDKLIILCKHRAYYDRFITVQDAQLCPVLGGCYIIEYNRTMHLTQIRKRLEELYNKMNT